MDKHFINFGGGKIKGECKGACACAYETRMGFELPVLWFFEMVLGWENNL